MPKWIAVGLVTLTAALAVAVIYQASYVGDLKHELGQLEANMARIESRQKKQEEAAPTRMEIKEIQEDIARVERKAQAQPAATEAPLSPDGRLPTYVTEEDIAQIVDDRIQERIEDGSIQAQGGNQGGGGDRKMPLSEISKELELDPAVEEQVAEVANQTKKDIFELLKTPRTDGTSFADDVVKVFTGGEPERAQELFTRLFTEKIPGTDTTYVVAIGNIQNEGRDKLRGFMGDATYDKYARMNVHPENIQTGWDPWAEYVQQQSGN